MKRSQWFVLGIGSIALSSFLFKDVIASGLCSVHEGDMLVACFVKRYLYAVPAIISHFLGWMFLICGWLEKNK